MIKDEFSLRDKLYLSGVSLFFQYCLHGYLYKYQVMYFKFLL